MTDLEPAPGSGPALVLHASRWRVALIGLGGVVLAASGVFMATRG